MSNSTTADPAILEGLNDLLAKCNDAEKGYQEAARAVQDKTLRSMFKEYAKQRFVFAQVLKEYLASLGGPIDDSGTLAGTLHRAWMDFRASITDEDEVAVLNEAIRGEHNALENYLQVMESISPTHKVYPTLLDHHSRIRAALDKLERLVPVYEG